MADESKDVNHPEYNSNVQPAGANGAAEALAKAYGDGEDGEKERTYALALIQHVNDDLQDRERNNLVTNGIPYSRAYLYNQQKAINYAPPRDLKDDRQISSGIIHEKIIAFVSVFLKYAFRRLITCYDADGNEIQGLGTVYDLAIEFSQRVEQFAKVIALMYWEVFSQGNAFVLEEWDVRNITVPQPMLEGKPIDAASMDFTLEFLEKLTYGAGTEIQTRMARSRVLDGRMVIFGNPEITEVQMQPRITIEDTIDRDDAEQLYGTLSRWAAVPKDKKSIDLIVPERITLFNVDRFNHPDKKIMRHITFDRVNNRYNLMLNGLMMLPRQTPMTVFYPRGNYPLTNVPAERLTGSIYARAVPAKAKFNADFLDWALKNLALKFEQGVIPPILAKGKYTLTRQMFRAGEVTHGVQPTDYAKVDPDNKGVTPSETGFFGLIKELIGEQTFSPAMLEDIPPNAPAQSIALADQNQRDMLAFLLDGIASGFMDIYLRRAETIESKYTIKQKETWVKGKRVSVYQNFTVMQQGTAHKVQWDDQMSKPGYNHKKVANALHMQKHADLKNGKNTKYYLIDPTKVRFGQHVVDIQIISDRLKESDLQLQSMWAEFKELMDTFQPNGQEGAINMQELQKIYLKTSGRPATIFNSADEVKLQQLQQQAQQLVPKVAAVAPGAMPPGAQPPANVQTKAPGKQARPAMLR